MGFISAPFAGQGITFNFSCWSNQFVVARECSELAICREQNTVLPLQTSSAVPATESFLIYLCTLSHSSVHQFVSAHLGRQQSSSPKQRLLTVDRETGSSSSAFKTLAEVKGLFALRSFKVSSWSGLVNFGLPVGLVVKQILFADIVCKCLLQFLLLF